MATTQSAVRWLDPVGKVGNTAGAGRVYIDIDHLQPMSFLMEGPPREKSTFSTCQMRIKVRRRVGDSASCAGRGRASGFEQSDRATADARVGVVERDRLRRSLGDMALAVKNALRNARQRCQPRSGGVHAARLGRKKEVLGLLNSLGATPHCLRVTSRAHPEHPLRLPSSCELRPFEG